MPASKIQDHAEVLRWFDEGRSYTWMCQEYERKYNLLTVPSMWGNFRRRHGLTHRINRDQALIPWKVEAEHRWDYDVVMLRLEARRRAGAAVHPRDRSRFEYWRASLDAQNLVISYDSTSGFARVPRRVGIDLDLIREHDGPPTSRRTVH